MAAWHLHLCLSSCKRGGLAVCRAAASAELPRLLLPLVSADGGPTFALRVAHSGQATIRVYFLSIV